MREEANRILAMSVALFNRDGTIENYVGAKEIGCNEETFWSAVDDVKRSGLAYFPMNAGPDGAICHIQPAAKLFVETNAMQYLEQFTRKFGG